MITGWLNKREIKLLLSFFIISILFAKWIGWNEYSTLDLTKSIAEEQRLEIDSFFNNTGDRAKINGHYYSDRPPGLSFLSVPVYYILNIFLPDETDTIFIEQNSYYNTTIENASLFSPIDNSLKTFIIYIVLISVFSSLPGALLVVLIYKTSRYFTKNETHRLIVTFVLSFGTLIFHYSTVYMNIITAVFFSFLSFYIIQKINHKDLNEENYFLAGLLSGFAFTINYYAIFMIPLLMLLFKNNKINFILGAFIGILPLLIYNTLIFSTPFDFTFLHIDKNVFPKLGEYLFLVPLEIGIPMIFRLLFLPMKGLFFYYPILILSIFGICYLLLENKRLGIFVSALFLIFIIINSFYPFFWGGTSFSLKHMTFVVPFLSIPLLFVMKKMHSKIFLGIFIIFASITFFHNTLGLGTWNDTMHSFMQNYIKSDTDEKYPMIYETGFSLEPINNPLYEHYLINFLRDGPRSKIIESITGKFLNIKDSFSTQFREIKLADTTNGFLVFNTQFLIIPIILLIVFIIWYKEIFDRQLFFYLIVTIIILLFVSRFELTEINFNEDFYTKNYKESFNFMEKEASIFYFSNSSKKEIMNISIGTFHKHRILKFTLNDINLGNYLIRSFDDFIIVPIELRKGKNEFKLTSNECDVPLKVTNYSKDWRCLSFAVKNISPLTLEKDTIITKGFESDGWISEKGFLYTNFSEDKSLIRFFSNSFKNGINSSIYLNNKKFSEIEIETAQKEFLIPIDMKKGLNIIEFKPNECIPSFEDETKDTRSLCINIKNLEFLNNKSSNIYYSNAYLTEQVKNLKYRWLTDNSILYLIRNHQNEISLNFSSWSYSKNRTLRMTLDNKIFSANLTTMPNYFEVNLTVKPGINKIQINIPEGCDVHSILENSNDDRCLSVTINNLMIR